MALDNTQNLEDELDTAYPDNSSGDITPGILRTQQASFITTTVQNNVKLIYTESDFDDGTDDPDEWTLTDGVSYLLSDAITLTRSLRFPAGSSITFCTTAPLQNVLAVIAPLTNALFRGIDLVAFQLLNISVINFAGTNTLFDINGDGSIGSFVDVEGSQLVDFTDYGSISDLSVQFTFGLFDNATFSRTAGLEISNCNFRVKGTIVGNTVGTDDGITVIRNINTPTDVAIEIDGLIVESTASGAAVYVEPLAFVGNPTILLSGGVIRGDGAFFETDQSGEITDIADNGSGFARITHVGGTPVNGSQVYLLGTDNYDGGATITAIGSGTFDIDVAFGAAEDYLETGGVFYDTGSLDQRVPDVKVGSIGGEVIPSQSIADATLPSPGFTLTVVAGVAEPISNNAGVNDWISSDASERFFIGLDGVVEFRGSNSIVATIIATVSMVGGGGNQELGLYIALNGATLPHSFATTQNNNPTSVTSVAALLIAPGDQIEAWVVNNDSTSVAISIAKILINGTA